MLLHRARSLDFTRLLVVAVLVALGATWIELTRRQTLLEFPDAQGTAFFADTWDRVSGWWDEQRAAAAKPAAARGAAGDGRRDEVGLRSPTCTRRAS